MNDSITAVAGIEVGHWTDPEGRTGCTVVSLPEPNAVTAEARGAAPGTREYALLQPGMRVTQAQAILLTGGSAFGLAAADGVVQALVDDGRGHETGLVRVPIVPSAVIFDFKPESLEARPGPREGAAAYQARTADQVDSGRLGAGTGATVAKWRGFEHMMPGGLGSASVDVGEHKVGAVVVVNAVGDAFTVAGESLTGGDHIPGPPNLPPRPGTNTTLAVVATDASLTREELSRLVVRAHDAYAVCLRPAHTRYDGDVVFAASVGSSTGNVEALAEGAFAATAKAIEKSVRAANA